MLRTAILLALTATAATGAAQAAPAGQTLYSDNCAACHQASGKGVSGAFPPLAGAAIAQGDARPLAGVVLDGRNEMPGFRDDMNDADLAALLTYVRSAWGNKGKPVAASDVAAARAKGGGDR